MSRRLCARRVNGYRIDPDDPRHRISQQILRIVDEDEEGEAPRELRIDDVNVNNDDQVQDDDLDESDFDDDPELEIKYEGNPHDPPDMVTIREITYPPDQEGENPVTLRLNAKVSFSLYLIEYSNGVWTIRKTFTDIGEAMYDFTVFQDSHKRME